MKKETLGTLFQLIFAFLGWLLLFVGTGFSPYVCLIPVIPVFLSGGWFLYTWLLKKV